MRNTSSSKSSEKNLENQRSINTQTLKILRIRISETMQIVSEFIRAEEFLSKNSEAICGDFIAILRSRILGELQAQREQQ